MASRWRIRHKLMFGLALVVGVMALLLCGTSRGLWSYYETTNGIRAKLNELVAAEEVKSAFNELVAPENAATLVDRPDLRVTEIEKVSRVIAAYGEQVEETLASTRDPRQGIYERDMIDRLREDIEQFRRQVEERAAARFGASDDGHFREGHKKALAKIIETCKRDAHDLRDSIKKSLDDRINGTREHYQGALMIIIPSSVVGIMVMAGLLVSFYAWVFSPIRDLELGVNRVAQGDLRHRIELHSGDEMEHLASAFNDMLGRLNAVYDDLARQVNERSRQLVRSERLASVGFLAAGVAHEINNPLASIAFCGEALEARLAELTRLMRPTGRATEEHEIFGKYLRMIQDEAFRCKNITERLLEFSRTGEPRREPTDLRELVQAVLDVTQHLSSHKDKHISFEVVTPPPYPLERGGGGSPAGRLLATVNAAEIKSVVLNLVINALESMEEDGQLSITLGHREGRAELRFTDTGCGMSHEVLENIFEPFFTRSRSGKGTGLGLTISHLIISQHGGEIEALSDGPGLGSTFVVRLPMQASGGEQTATPVGFEQQQQRPAGTPGRPALSGRVAA